MRGSTIQKLITILFYCCLVICTHAQDSNFFFHHITPDDNLQGAYYSSAFKDSKGLVWIGSSTAVNVFDGTEVHAYKADTTQGLTDATYFNRFFEDDAHNIWITSGNGLHLFERATSSFHFFDLDSTLSNYRAFHIDSSNHLWFTTSANDEKISVHKFNLLTKDTENTIVGVIDECYRNTAVLDENGRVIKIVSSYLLPEIQGGKGIQIYDVKYNDDSIEIEQAELPKINKFSTRNGIVINDTLWMTGVNALLAVDIINFEHEIFDVFPKEKREIILWDIENWGDEKLLISSNDGLYIFDKNKKEFVQKIKTIQNRKGNFLENDISELYIDDDNILWMSHWMEGISYVNLNKQQFNQIDELVGKEVLHLIKDAQEKIWVSTAEDGVFIFDKNGKLITGPINTDSSKRGSVVFQQLFLYNNEVWANSGMYIYKWNKDKFELSYRDRPYIDFFLLENESLVGYSMNSGLFNIDLKNKTSQPWNEINGIKCTDLKNIFSFDFGKIYYSNTNKIAIQILTNDGQLKNISSKDHIYDFYKIPESQKVLMATNNGLKILNSNTFEIDKLGIKDSLPHLIYYDIIEGTNNEVWLASNEGLVSYNYVSKKWKHYNITHGLQGKFFKENNSLKTSNGKIWIGGRKGLNIFDPKEIQAYQPKANIYFNDFMVNNESYQLGNHIDNQDEIIALTYDQNSIKLGFAAMDHSDNAQVKARYKIEGLSDEWIDCNRKDEITFFQQPAGTYTLMVEATNSEGGSPVLRERQVRIAPPFWKTWWFCLLVFLLGIALLYWFYQNELKKRLAGQEIANLQALNQFKNTVYTNITHEFKTPITIIKGYADLIKGNEKEKQIIERSSDDLLRLINQILDIAKLESGNLSMNIIGGDVIVYLKHLVEPIQAWAKKEGKQFSVFFEKESWMMDYDEQKLENIVMNLLSNAIKFTLEDGKIEMRVKEDILEGEKYIKIEVKDSGVGIPKEYQSQIFNRHFQVPNDKKMNKGGTGIGLAFCKELAEFMGGSINLESEEGKGSNFKVWLPATNNLHIEELHEKVEIKPTVIVDKFETSTSGVDERPVLLIIEDNRDVADIIRLSVSHKYQILMAHDGEKGIAIAKENLPDLIVSDVMMPFKDGFEVVQSLKNDINTSHIPIILLTAKDSYESEIAGLKRGADVYLRKPFKSELLMVYLSNQLKHVKTLQSRYENLKPTSPPKDKGQKMEDQFVKKLKDHIEKNLTTVNPKALEKVALMSTSSLNRKLKAIMGKTPSQFINFVKLHLSKDLLKKDDQSIYNIALEVGFNSADHFSREFKNLFDSTPSDFRNGLKNS